MQKQNVSFFVLVLVGLCAFAFSAEAKRARKKISPNKVAFHKGELIRYKIKIGEVDGGYSYLFVKDVKKADKELKMKATMKFRTNAFFDKIHRVNNKFTSFFAMLGKRFFRYRLDVDQAGWIQLRKLSFDSKPKAGRLKLSVKSGRGKKYRNYKYEKKKAKRKFTRSWKRKLRVPRDTFDLVSGIYHARALRYKKGRKFSFHVYSAGRLWKLTGKMVGKERFYSALGPRTTYKLEAKAYCLTRPQSSRVLRVWLTADHLRIPLRIQGKVPYLGYVTANIAGYRKSLKSRYIDGRHRGRLRNLFGRF